MSQAQTNEKEAGAALYKEWKSLSGAEKTAFWRQNEKALLAYGQTVEREAQEMAKKHRRQSE